jgi:hypothetical protein
VRLLKKQIFLILFALFSLRFEGNLLIAQVLYGSFTGSVTDPSNAPVTGARVRALNVATGVASEGICNDSGVFLISDVQAGTYRITITAPSFQTVEESNVQLTANTVRRLDVHLELGQVTQNVTVDASALALQTDRADVSMDLPSQEVGTLPLGANRNFQSLYTLVPGFSPPVASHSEAANPSGALATNVNGGGSSNNNTRLDGTTDSNFFQGNILAYVPPAESIEAVNIVTASYDAEQGMAGGAAVNIATKSGTNAFHGSAWEYNTNSDLKARNFFYYGANNPKNILNQFGLSVGGPIRKNKLFFFADWERYRLRQNESGFQTVPTTPLRLGNFAGTGTTIYNPFTGAANGAGRTPFANNQIPVAYLSPQAQAMVSLIPQPTLSGISNNYFSSAGLQFNRDQVDLKVTYNPDSKSSVFARYSGMPSSIFDPSPLGAAGGGPLDGGQPGNAPGLTQLASVGGNYSFTPNLVLDGNVGFQRYDLVANPPNAGQNIGLNQLGIPGTNGPNPLQGGIPFFSISGFSSLGDTVSSNPFVFRDNAFLYAANLSWVKGSHSFRFGGEFDRYQVNDYQAQTLYGVRGGFNFTGGLTALNGGPAPSLYNAWADFMLGLPQAMGKDYQYVDPSTMRESVYAFYARDRWQVTRKLTVDYGVRWEYYPLGTWNHVGAPRYDPTTNIAYLGGVNGVPQNAGIHVGGGQFAPRLGVAYRLSDRTVVRAGYGISTDPYLFTNVRDAYPAIISQQFVGANSYSAAGSLATGLPPLIGPNLSLGSWQFPTNLAALTYPANFDRGYIESFNLTVQRDMGLGIEAQAAYVGTRTRRFVSGININAAGPGGGNAGTPLYPLFGNANNITVMQPTSGPEYNALQTQVKRRMRGGFLVGAAYTYSRTIDYTDNEDGQSGSDTFIFNWPAVLNRNKALAGYDRTHNFQAYWTYALPFGSGQRWAAHGFAAATLGGWTIDGTLSRESGIPFSVLASGTSLNAPGNTQTANQVVPNVSILGGHGPGQPYFNPNAFAPVTTVQFGNTGRDILRGPGLFNVNVGLFRDFSLKENLKLQFRAEAYGLTNTPQFANPSATVSNATFSNGMVTNLNGYDTISSSTGERQLRFALKLSF